MVSLAILFLSSSLEYVVTDCFLVMRMRLGAFSPLQVWMTHRMHAGRAQIVSIGSRRWSVSQTIAAVGPIARTNGECILGASCPHISLGMMLITTSFHNVR